MNFGTKKGNKNDKSTIEKLFSPLPFEIKRKSNNDNKSKRTTQNLRLINAIMAERKKQNDKTEQDTSNLITNFKLNQKNITSNSDEDTGIKMNNELKSIISQKIHSGLQKTGNLKTRSNVEVKTATSIDVKLDKNKTYEEKTNSNPILNNSQLIISISHKNVFKNDTILNTSKNNSINRKIGESDYSSNTFSEVFHFNDCNSRKKSTIIKLMNLHHNGEEEFFEGTIIKSRKSGFCRILYSIGLLVEANFVDGNIEGEGNFCFINGVSVFGLFKNNQLHSRIHLSIDNYTHFLDFMEGEYHNDQIYMSDKNVFFVPFKSCNNINEYNGKMRVYFRNGYKLDVLFEKGLALENSECTLTDKFDSPMRGKIKHGLHVMKNQMFIFRPFNDQENEYLLLFKGEGTIVRKHKK